MICKERSIGLPWFSTKTQIMTLFCLASRHAPSWYIQLNQQLSMFLKISGGIARLLSPWLQDQLARLVSITYNSDSQTFMTCAPPSKDSQYLWPLLINKNT